jgi:hypothetical protein
VTIERERPADEATVLDPSGADEFDDEYFLDQEDAEEDDWPRPAWLPPDCLGVGFALDMGTCCKNPDNRLVGVAVDLADLVDLSLRRLGNVECEGPDAELAYRLKLIPGLLAQIHAILPRLNPTAVAQLLCPVGRPQLPVRLRGRRHAQAASRVRTPRPPAIGLPGGSARPSRLAAPLADPALPAQARPRASAAAWAQARDAP